MSKVDIAFSVKLRGLPLAVRVEVAADRAVYIT